MEFTSLLYRTLPESGKVFDLLGFDSLIARRYFVWRQRASERLVSWHKKRLARLDPVEASVFADCELVKAREEGITASDPRYPILSDVIEH